MSQKLNRHLGAKHRMMVINHYRPSIFHPFPFIVTTTPGPRYNGATSSTTGPLSLTPWHRRSSSILSIELSEHWTGLGICPFCSRPYHPIEWRYLLGKIHSANSIPLWSRYRSLVSSVLCKHLPSTLHSHHFATRSIDRWGTTADVQFSFESRTVPSLLSKGWINPQKWPKLIETII